MCPCSPHTRNPDQRTLSSEFENVIVLSDDFYQELIAHPVPNDLDAVKVLAASPAVLDLFMWLSYRCFTARGVETIPLFGDFGLAHQIGTTDYSRPRRFRAMIEQWLETIRALWPQCPARISADGQEIVLKHAPAVLPATAAALEDEAFHQYRER
jgi:replication initiator protein